MKSFEMKSITVDGKLNEILESLHEIKLRLASMEQRMATLESAHKPTPIIQDTNKPDPFLYD